MKKHFILHVLAVAVISLSVCSTVSRAESWTYPEGMADFPYYEGLGTEESPYLINSAQQLANLAWHVNNGSNYEGVYFALTADIDLNPGFTFASDGTIEGNGEPKAWVPIGHDWSHYIEFNGNFDGRGHTVSGLYLDLTYSGNGLFGATQDGKISNLNIRNSLAKGDVMTEKCSYVGLVVGWMDSGKIENCHNHGCSIYRDALSFTPDPFPFETFAGGIAGELYCSSIEGCSNSGNVKCECIETGYIISTTSTGGIVGYFEGFDDVSMSDCTNSGNIYCSGMAGGIVGYMNTNNAKAVNLSNEGEINAELQAGGIIGYGSVAEMSECYNYGLITSHWSGELGDGPEIGGIGGYLSVSDVMTHCFNKGKVIYGGKLGYVSRVAGLVGEFMSSNIQINDCFNEATVSGYGTVGGLFAFYSFGSAVLTNCYNIGDVSTVDIDEEPLSNNLGGLIGNGSGTNSLKLTGCYNAGDVNGLYCGSVAGLCCMDVQEMDSCYNSGDIEGIRACGLVDGSVYNMTYCYNEGDIHGLTNGFSDYEIVAAGLVSIMDGKMRYCHNSGTISKELSYLYYPDDCCCAGLCLNLYNSDVDQCYNDGDVLGLYNSAGLFGVMSSSSVRNCYNAGKVTGDYITGGVAAIYDCTGYEKDTIANTFSYGDVMLANSSNWDTKRSMFIGHIKSSTFYSEASLNVVDCYYKEMEADDVPGVSQNDNTDISGLSACTEADFASGRVCILLNGTQDPTPWGQDVGIDPYPLLNGKGNPDDVGIRLPESFTLESLDGQPVYDVEGRRVYAPLNSLHGIYIIGGHKVLLP